MLLPDLDFRMLKRVTMKLRLLCAHSGREKGLILASAGAVAAVSFWVGVLTDMYVVDMEGSIEHVSESPLSSVKCRRVD